MLQLKSVLGQGYQNRIRGSFLKLMSLVLPITFVLSGNSCTAKCGLLDLKGHVILPREYDSIQYVAPDRFIGYSGQETSTSWFPQRMYSTKMTLFDKNGVELPITDDILEKANTIPFPKNLPAGTGVNEKQGSLLTIGNSKGIGLCDRFGNVIVPCNYQTIVFVGESKFVAEKRDANNKAEFFLFDSHGNLISTLPSDTDIRSGIFHDGMLRIGAAAFVNSQGQTVVPTGKYESFYDFSEGYVAVTFKSGTKTQSGFLNTKGALALGPFDGLQLFSFQKGLALVTSEKTGKIGAIDKTGKMIIPIEFDKLTISEDGTLLGKKNERYQTMTNTGELLVQLPSKFDPQTASYSPINERYIPFSVDDGYYYTSALPTSLEKKTKYGISDLDGKVIVKPRFDYISPFSGIHATAYKLKGKQKRIGVINNHGQWTLAPSVESPLYLVSKDRIVSGTAMDVEKSVEESWKGNHEGNCWYTSEALVARTLERYNLIGMKLTDITKLMGDGNKDEIPRPGPRGICERRAFSIPVGCLGSAAFELGFDAKQKLVGWQIRHGETQENWIFENVVGFTPFDRYRSSIGVFIPKVQSASLRKAFPK
ncbi:MAG: WG repeat-containing protein [Cyanobacteria bacterium SZAS-4]|nr:WG repeat-containing protein [Cyanobacteria bacterium SZAS-4]